MKNKLIVGILLIVIGAVLAILGIPFFALDNRFNPDTLGSTMIYLLLLVGGIVFIIGGIASMVTKNEPGHDHVENVWPQPIEKKPKQSSDAGEEPQETTDENLL